MGLADTKALFYSIDVSKVALANLILGTVEPIGSDMVEFDKEDGGEAIRQLALPRLSGMDEVAIDVAQMRIRSVGRPIEISNFSQQPGPGGQGVFLTLPKPGRLLKVEVEYVAPVVTPPTPPLHLVVRAARKSDVGMQVGVPLFADPDFPPPGNMFPRALTGMSKTSLGSNRFRLNLPSALGDAWLIQLATGNSAVELTPIATPVTIRKVTLDAVVSNVSVVLVTPTAEVTLWANPQIFLPSNELEDISFTPLAQKELTAALKATSDDELTLPLTIKFRSDTGGALAIVSKTLQGRYLVNTLNPLPASLNLAGGRVPLVLSAPAGLTPESAQFRLVAKLKGWELNNASSEPPVATPSAGLRVTQNTRVAQQVQFEGTLPLATVRLLLACEGAAEAILELHEDANGGPGALLVDPLVKQLDPGLRDWVDFELKTPLSFAVDSTTLWVTLHVTKGEVFWFASETTASALISTDEGVSWGPPDARLAEPTAQVVQLLHEVSPSQLAKPVIRVERGNAPVAADLMANARALSAKEYVVDNASLPATVMSFFQQQSGKQRVEQKLQLFSTSVLDLRVESASFFYDPFQPGHVGA